MNTDKQILVLGSAVADVIIRLEDHLPVTGEDVHVLSQEIHLGGCAYNTFDMIRHFHEPAIPFFPVGTGAYADFVRESLLHKGIVSPIPSPPEPNGCCYCFIEADGERTFISYHGAEYRFRPEWFRLLDSEKTDMAYVCGLELEEDTGCHIIDFFKREPHIQLFFSPGPRLHKIEASRMDELLSLHPVMHMNQEEALSFTGASDVSQAAIRLYTRTARPVIITLGADGCFWYDGKTQELVPGVPAVQIDTTGAGDAHIGAVIACLHRGDTLGEAVRTANRAASKVVSVHGALLDDETVF